MPEKQPQSQVVVRFQDCDAFGHLNNVQFIHYVINAREDHLRTHYQFDLYDYARQHGANWLVTKHEIAYLRPAQLGEVVTIRTGLLRFTDHDLMVEGVMLDEAEQQLKAVQWTTFRYVDLQRGRTITHPADVLDLFQSIVVDEEVEGDNLDLRVRQIKEAQRTDRRGVA